MSSEHNEGQIAAAEQWLQLGRHGLFANAGELNHAILARWGIYLFCDSAKLI